MIVVGFLGGAGGSAKLALEIARRGAAAGSRVEMVGVAPADASGDAILLELAAAGVGHATVIRSRATTLEPADVDLALRYLPDIHAIVLVAPEAALLPAVRGATDWAGAALVIVGATEGAPPSAIVLDPPPADPDGTFAGFVADLAVRLDAGATPEAAFRATVSTLAADQVTG